MPLFSFFLVIVIIETECQLYQLPETVLHIHSPTFLYLKEDGDNVTVPYDELKSVLIQIIQFFQ